MSVLCVLEIHPLEECVSGTFQGLTYVNEKALRKWEVCLSLCFMYSQCLLFDLAFNFVSTEVLLCRCFAFEAVIHSDVWTLHAIVTNVSWHDNMSCHWPSFLKSSQMKRVKHKERRVRCQTVLAGTVVKQKIAGRADRLCCPEVVLLFLASVSSSPSFSPPSCPLSLALLMWRQPFTAHLLSGITLDLCTLCFLIG